MSLSKSPNVLRWFCLLACKHWGLHLWLSALSDGTALGPITLTSEIMLPFMISHRVSYICLLQGRGLQQCWSYLLIKWSTWTDPLWLIYYSFLNAQSNSHLVLTSLMGPPCITHTHRHMPSVPSTAECLNFNFILASCLDSPQVHKDGST